MPLQFSAGGPPHEPGDVAINQSLATLYGVGVGDQLAIGNGQFLGRAVTHGRTHTWSGCSSPPAATSTTSTWS